LNAQAVRAKIATGGRATNYNNHASDVRSKGASLSEKKYISGGNLG
jgi:hypothetical protein